MALQRRNRFKTAFLTLSFAAIVAGGTFWFSGGFDSLKEVLSQNQGVQEQTQLVESAVNENYNENVSSDYYQTDSLEEYVPKYDFEQLRQINPNIVGVIEGDIFEGGYYPVVSSESFDELNDNLYKSIDGSYNTIGTLTVDPNSLDNMQGNVTRIWGHHFGHEEDTGKMFSSLVNYDNQDFYNNHKKLKYYTEFGEYELDIFACTKDNPMNQPVGNVDNFEENMNDVISRSMIHTDVTPGDRVMTLTTCTREGSINDPENRISVYASVNPVYEKRIQTGKTL